MAGRKLKFRIADFEAAIPNSGGIIATIAARVGCEWHTAQRYCRDNEKLSRMIADEEERGVDVAESVILTNIQTAAKLQRRSEYTELVDTSDAKWYLLQKGRGRGYGNAAQIDHNVTVDPGAKAWDIFGELDRIAQRLTERDALTTGDHDPTD